MDWNDLRYFLAVAETGSTLAAGRALGVSQTTVARRIAALEEGLALQLFERRQAGYRPTAAGEALVAPAGAMARAAALVADAAAAQARDLSGTVRLTASRIIAETVLQPILRDLHRLHPGIMVELDTGDEFRDLAAGGADVAIRSCVTPEGAGLVGRRIADEVWGIYASQTYVEEHGLPSNRALLHGHEFIGGGGAGVWREYGAWLDQEGLGDRVAMHQATATGLLAAVRAGAGLAVLPCLVAENDPALVRCLPVGASPRRELWLLTHERLRHTPRVRAVMAVVAERLARLATAIPPRQPAPAGTGEGG